MSLTRRFLVVEVRRQQNRSFFRGFFAQLDRSSTVTPNNVHYQMKLDSAKTVNPKLLENAITNKRRKTEILAPTFIDSSSFRDVLNDIDTFIFDADGVLWLGDAAIPGSSSLIELLVKKGKQIIVLTNNATKSRAVYANKLRKMGFNAELNKDNLVNPAAVVADTLKQFKVNGRKKVYLIGSKGVRDEMDELGIEYFGHGPEPQDNSDGSAFMYQIDLDEKPCDVGAVVVGYEKHFNYHKLMKAANYLKRPDCLFLATNEDETCPGPDPNVVIPDAGPLVAAVRCASGREPITVGKPNTPAFEYISRKWSINPARTLMIGDRTNTDVKFGRDHGLKTLLVLSVCHQLSDVQQNQMNNRTDMVPHYYATDLASLVP